MILAFFRQECVDVSETRTWSIEESLRKITRLMRDGGACAVRILLKRRDTGGGAGWER